MGKYGGKSYWGLYVQDVGWYYGVENGRPAFKKEFDVFTVCLYIRERKAEEARAREIFNHEDMRKKYRGKVFTVKVDKEKTIAMGRNFDNEWRRKKRGIPE